MNRARSNQVELASFGLDNEHFFYVVVPVKGITPFGRAVELNVYFSVKGAGKILGQIL